MARPPRSRRSAAKRPELGFQDDQALFGPQQNALLDAMKRSGGDAVRMNVIYGKVKREGLGAYDQLVNAARARGLTPQMTLMGTPRYNPDDDQALSYKNTNPRLMQQFASDVAKHFKGRVGRYSIWNEPNYPGFISDADTKPKEAARRYRELYKAGYAGVKGSDRSAQVLLGEMTSSPGTRTFLKNVLAGKPLKTAGFAFHPYDQSPAHVQGSDTWDIDELKDLQKTLAGYKRSGKLQTAQGKAAPLYLTEFGYQRGEGSDAERARQVARGYDLATKAGARQLLQYQVTAKERPTVTTPGSTDDYGRHTPGGSKPGWVWDTSVDPSMLAHALRNSQVRARAARKR